jgi:hypothetical protein
MYTPRFQTVSGPSGHLGVHSVVSGAAESGISANPCRHRRGGCARQDRAGRACRDRLRRPCRGTQPMLRMAEGRPWRRTDGHGAPQRRRHTWLPAHSRHQTGARARQVPSLPRTGGQHLGRGHGQWPGAEHGGVPGDPCRGADAASGTRERRRQRGLRLSRLPPVPSRVAGVAFPFHAKRHALPTPSNSQRTRRIQQLMAAYLWRRVIDAQSRALRRRPTITASDR